MRVCQMKWQRCQNRPRESRDGYCSRSVSTKYEVRSTNASYFRLRTSRPYPQDDTGHEEIERHHRDGGDVGEEAETKERRRREQQPRLLTLEKDHETEEPREQKEHVIQITEGEP